MVIADDHDGPHEAAHPGWVLSPDLPATTAAVAAAAPGAFEWRPERAPQGPLSLLISGGERAVYVYRNGVEIGRAPFAFRGETTRLPEGVYTVLDGEGTHRSPFHAGRPDHRWMGVPLDHTPPDESIEKAALAALIAIPEEFGARVYEALGPGATIFVTNREVAPHTASAADFVILATHADQVSG